MNPTVLEMKKMSRAMKSYVLTLYEIVLETNPEFVLEIGTGQCQSTRAILSALAENKKGKLVSVDLGDRAERISKELLEYFIQVIGDSHEKSVFDKVKEKNVQVYDILFIDGDHSYEGVKKDFEMYSPLVKERGLILMHDICNRNCGVPEFWKEIKYPKIGFEYGKAAAGIIPGFGIVEKITL